MFVSMLERNRANTCHICTKMKADCVLPCFSSSCVCVCVFNSKNLFQTQCVESNVFFSIDVKDIGKIKSVYLQRCNKQTELSAK